MKNDCVRHNDLLRKISVKTKAIPASFDKKFILVSAIFFVLWYDLSFHFNLLYYLIVIDTSLCKQWIHFQHVQFILFCYVALNYFILHFYIIYIQIYTFACFFFININLFLTFCILSLLTLFRLISATIACYILRLLRSALIRGRLLEGGTYFKVREINNIKCQHFVISLSK